MNINITPKQYEEIEEMINEWYGLSIPYSELKKAIEKDEFIVGEASKGYLKDTVVREAIVDAISKYLINKHWPIGADSEKYSQDFYNELETKIKEIGGEFDREQYRED